MSNMQLVKDFVEGSHLIGVIIDVLCRRQSQFVEKQLQAYNIQFKTFTLILHFWLKCLLGKCHCNKINVNILLNVFNVSILDKRHPKLCRVIITSPPPPQCILAKFFITVLALLLAFGILSMKSYTLVLTLLLLFRKDDSSTKPQILTLSLSSSFQLPHSGLYSSSSSLSSTSSSSFKASFDLKRIKKLVNTIKTKLISTSVIDLPCAVLEPSNVSFRFHFRALLRKGGAKFL